MFSYKSKQRAKVEEYRSSCPTRKPSLKDSGPDQIRGIASCPWRSLTYRNEQPFDKVARGD